MKQKITKDGMAASLTVEAAAVFSIVLLSVMALILFCFRLHDRVAASNALIFAVESYSHRNKNASWAEDYRTVAENTEIYITGEGQAVELEPGLLRGSMTGTVRYGEDTWIWKNKHLHTETFLRMATMTELTEKLKKSGGDKEKTGKTEEKQ